MPTSLNPPLPPTPKVAAAGLIGIVIAQSPEFVAPHGAKKAVFGTNPIAIGMPTEGGRAALAHLAGCFPLTSRSICRSFILARHATAHPTAHLHQPPPQANPS